MSNLIADIVKILRNIFKSKRLHKVYVYFRCYDFVNSVEPLAEKICYCLGLRKEWEVHQKELDRLFKLIFGENHDKDI